MKLAPRRAIAVTSLTVLAAGAGGIAWAESGGSSPSPSGSTPSTSSPSTSSPPAATSDGATAKHRANHARLGRHVLHGEFVVQTRDGYKTVDVARGVVTAVTASSMSVRSADGVVSTFVIDDKSKARSKGKSVALTSIHVGDRVAVMAVKTGAAAHARLIRVLPASAGSSGG